MDNEIMSLPPACLQNEESLSDQHTDSGILIEKKTIRTARINNWNPFLILYSNHWKQTQNRHIILALCTSAIQGGSFWLYI